MPGDFERPDVSPIYGMPESKETKHTLKCGMPDVPREGLPLPTQPTDISLPEQVDHPSHYGGKENVYEAIKVIDAWRLNFSLGNAVKYIARADKKGKPIEDLKKALWYLNHEIEIREAATHEDSEA